MGFPDLIEILRNPGEDGLPETIYDDLSGEYAAVVDGAAARESAHADIVQGLQSEISALKAQNFDLLMAQQAQAGNTDSDSSDEDTSEDENPTIDSLFG